MFTFKSNEFSTKNKKELQVLLDAVNGHIHDLKVQKASKEDIDTTTKLYYKLYKIIHEQ